MKENDKIKKIENAYDFFEENKKQEEDVFDYSYWEDNSSDERVERYLGNAYDFEQ